LVVFYNIINKRKATKLKLFNYCYQKNCNTIYATENSECYAIEMKIHREGYRTLTIAIISLQSQDMTIIQFTPLLSDILEYIDTRITLGLI